MISYDGEECGAPAGRVRLLVALRWVASGQRPLSRVRPFRVALDAFLTAVPYHTITRKCTRFSVKLNLMEGDLSACFTCVRAPLVTGPLAPSLPSLAAGVRLPRHLLPTT